LPGGDRSLGVVEADHRAGVDGAAGQPAVGADLGDGPVAGGQGAVHPGDGDRIEGDGVDGRVATDDHPAGGDVDGDDVPAPSVGTVAYPPPLADGDQLYGVDRPDG